MTTHTDDTLLERRIDRHSAAVIVVDAQNDFCHPDGLQAQQGKDLSAIAAPLAALSTFLTAARTVEVPVVFIRNLHSDATDTPEWLGRHPDPRRRSSCRVGTWGAEFAIAPEPGDLLVDKHRYSAFVGTDLEQQLRRLRRTSLLFTGFTTATCVESSLRDAVCLDFLATLVTDCCGAYTERAHNRAVEAVREGFGVVAASTEIIGAWAGQRADSTG